MLPLFLLIALTAVMVIVGLLRPPLNFTIPVLAALGIIMALPMFFPSINYPIHYLAISLVGLPIGWGISMILLRFLKIDTSLRARRRTERKNKADELNLEDIERIIDSTIESWRSQGGRGGYAERIEYYETWGDAMIRIGRYHVALRDSLRLMDEEARRLSRISRYVERSNLLGFSVETPGRREGRRGRVSAGRVIYMDPAELGTMLSLELPRLRSTMAELDKAMDTMARELLNYVGNSPIMVLYRDGVPRRVFILPKSFGQYIT